MIERTQRNVQHEADMAIKQAYPEAAQNRMRDDANYAIHAIAVHCNITSDAVMMRALSVIGDIDTVPELLAFRASIDTLDLSGITADAYPPYRGITADYFKAILRSITAYRLIRQVRNWADAVIATGEYTRCPVIK